MGKPPPSRYRIVEKDRRLTVIDTWAKDGSLSAPAAPRVQRHDNKRAPGASGSGESSNDLLHRLALAACRGARDPAGRPVFTTYPWFDTLAPRSFALGRSGGRRLGSAMLGLILVAITVVMLAATADFAAWFAMVFVIAIFAGRGKPLVTRWADGFATLPDD